MEVNLTEGMVEKMWKGEVTSEEHGIPVLQVTELKLVQSKHQQQQQQQRQPEHNKERFRLVLSDGIHLQQGMLSVAQNDLVKNGILQIGSIVELTRFACNVIQGRRFLVVLQMEVIVEKYDIIGNPVPPPRPTNAQFGSSLASGNSMDKPNAVGLLQQPARISQLQGNSIIGAPESGLSAMNTASLGPRTAYEGGPVTKSGSSVSMGSYGNQNMDFRTPKQEISRLGSYNLPTQHGYQRSMAPMYGNRGPVARNEALPRIIPIAALNPYQGRWTIKARVTAKGELRHYNNFRGDGKVFSFDLLDADGGEIRVTCFNAAVDQFYNQIEAQKVYLISRGSLRPAQKNFNHLRNDFEIYLDSASTIQQCVEDDVSIPRQQFHFCPISDVESMESNSIVDIIGVVSSINPTASIMRKNGTETQKRSLQLKDMSGRSVELTLWGSFCNAEGQRLQNLCDSGAFPILAVKAGRVSDFNGKAVGTIATSQLFIELDCPESCKLKGWFEKEGKYTPSVSISREVSSTGRPDVRKTISQIKDEKLGTSEKPDWITVCATIIYVKSDNFCYSACPLMIGDRQCNKKVVNNGDGTWRCDRCDKCVNECEFRYILQLQIQDHTGLTWVTAFQEAGEEIMGISAKDLYYVKYEHQDDERFAEIIRKVAFTKHLFRLKVKEETFSDEQRVKVTVLRSEKVNYSSECSFILGLMDKLKARDSTSSAVESEMNSDLNRIVSVGTKDFGSVANQMGQYTSQSAGSRPLVIGAPTIMKSCNGCGSSSHASADCPSIMSDPGQYMGGAYMSRVTSGGGSGLTPGRYGGPSRQQVGGY